MKKIIENFSTKVKYLLPVLLVVVCSFMAACSNGDDPKTTRYTVTFDSDGGSEVQSQIVPDGGTATKPADPTKDGFDFIHWINIVDDAEWIFSTPITENITLKAIWILEGTRYTVSFNSDGGSWVAAQSVIEGNTATRPTDPTKNYFTFVDWFHGESVTAWNFETAITEDITLTARWELEEGVSTVTFDPNGGIGGPPPMLFKLGDLVSVESDGGINLSDHGFSPINGELHLAGYSTVRVDVSEHPNPILNDAGTGIWYFDTNSTYGPDDLWIRFLASVTPGVHTWPHDGDDIALYAVWSVTRPVWWP